MTTIISPFLGGIESVPLVQWRKFWPKEEGFPLVLILYPVMVSRQGYIHVNSVYSDISNCLLDAGPMFEIWPETLDETEAAK